ncbi:MAG: hypothetical protein EOO36_04360 [Cytophagaceae bacterium]|nr:MAG: hypothetical protein EOO36_04360 [Cytophagaceae bacterium]
MPRAPCLADFTQKNRTFGLVASRLGCPSFWLWFALGWLLPIVSFLLLFALIAREELDPGRRLLGEARQILREAEAKKISS